MGYTKYRFSFGPWNVHSGMDPFGPAVREEFNFVEKLRMYRKLGFEGIQFHDDDVVKDGLPYKETINGAKKIRKLIADEGLEVEFIAPRLWEDSKTIDGAITSNNLSDRKYALERSKKAIDIANILNTKKIVLWPAREGTYIRESKNSKTIVDQFIEFINILLEYDKEIKILGEMKPNEPMDHAFLPTPAHFIAISYRTIDPSRVGVLIESAHCILAGLDPSDEMGYALSFNKLWGVHLNDQNGLKFDEDKTFGSVDIRKAFNQVRVLEENGYGRNGEFIGLDIKAMRTQPKEISYKHLTNSKKIFEKLVSIVRSCDKKLINKYINIRDYEELEYYIISQIMRK